MFKILSQMSTSKADARDLWWEKLQITLDWRWIVGFYKYIQEFVSEAYKTLNMLFNQFQRCLMKRIFEEKYLELSFFQD